MRIQCCILLADVATATCSIQLFKLCSRRDKRGFDEDVLVNHASWTFAGDRDLRLRGNADSVASHHCRSRCICDARCQIAHRLDSTNDPNASDSTNDRFILLIPNLRFIRWTAQARWINLTIETTWILAYYGLRLMYTGHLLTIVDVRINTAIQGSHFLFSWIFLCEQSYDATPLPHRK